MPPKQPPKQSSGPKQSWNDRRRKEQRISPRWKDEWPEFRKICEHRLAQGHREYGDRSFDRPLFSLLEEVEEEILDQVNWSFIAWTRLRSLRGQVQLIEDQLADTQVTLLLEQLNQKLSSKGEVDSYE